MFIELYDIQLNFIYVYGLTTEPMFEYNLFSLTP